MIQGLKFHFSGTEVKGFLKSRANECRSMAEEWSASLAGRKIILPSDGETEKLAKTHAKACAFDADMFEVAAAHTVESETYELSHQDFQMLGIQRTINDQKSVDEFLKVKSSPIVKAVSVMPTHKN